LRQLKRALEVAMKFIVKVQAQEFFKDGVPQTERAAVEKAITAAVGTALKEIDHRVFAKIAEVQKLRIDAEKILTTLLELSKGEVPVEIAVRHNEPFTVKPRLVAVPRGAAQQGAPAGGAIGKGERAVLTAIAQHSEGVSRDQLSILTGYKRSTRDAYVQRLSAAALVVIDGDRIGASAEGIAALGESFERLPTGDQLREHWLKRLPEGERLCLEAILQAWPNPLARDYIGEATGYKRSTRDAYLQRLAARRLIIVDRGTARAADHLFDEGVNAARA
jgi:hypothetical protein